MATRSRSRSPSPSPEVTERPAGPGRIADAHPRIRAHRRFALHEVTLDGLPVGGATVDAWHDGGDVPRWSARLLMPFAHELRGGVLAGTALGGQRLSGVVQQGEATPGLRVGRDLLVEFHGESPLRLENRPAADGQASSALNPA